MHPTPPRSLFAFLCAAALALGVAAAATPRAFVEDNAQKVLTILNSSATEDEKIKQLELLAGTTIDFETVSRLVLAKSWKEFSPDQRVAFQQEFKKALSVTYGRRIGQYGREKIVVVGERPEQLGDVTVQSKIVGGQVSGELKVDYRLRQKDGQWYVIDIIVEGVSIVSSYRSQFQEVVGQGGPPKLLAQLREKNANGEGLAPVESETSAVQAGQ